LLVAVTLVFVGVTAAGAHGSVLGYVQAGAEASMVGGIADWFAVTALFRRPLGLPIPHTAIIVERKDQFAETLGRFVQENFLNGDVLAERISTAGLVPRLSAWLTDPTHAARVSADAADLVVTLADTLQDEDVQAVLNAEINRALEGTDVAPLAGHALRVLTSGDTHAELFNLIVGAANNYLGDNYYELRERFEAEGSRWVPDVAHRIVFDRVYDRLRSRLTAMIPDPKDETRLQFEAWLAALPLRLESSPELQARGDLLKQELLESAELRQWSTAIWQQAKDTLRAQAANPDSELRLRLAELLMAGGRRLAADAQLQRGLERVVETAVRSLGAQFHDELAGLVTGTIARWDATETANQLELLLGRDLQFIRINGTVVGAAIGLALHAIAQAVS
jgi:uncharacterized membrane-anchored protein YjiN (DUF445 family)